MAAFKGTGQPGTQASQMFPHQPMGRAPNPQSPQPPQAISDMHKQFMQQAQQGQTSRKAMHMTRQRGMNDPKRAFGALSKLTKNMNPQQLQQLQQGMGKIFGQNFGGLGAGNQAAEAFGNLQSSGQARTKMQEFLNSGIGKKGRFGGQDFRKFAEGNKSQGEAGSQIHQLMADMGFTGPGSAMGQRPPMGTMPTLPGGPSGPMQPPIGQPPMGGPMQPPHPGLPPGMPVGVGGGPMPGGPMPGGPMPGWPPGGMPQPGSAGNPIPGMPQPGQPPMGGPMPGGPPQPGQGPMPPWQPSGMPQPGQPPTGLPQPALAQNMAAMGGVGGSV